MRKLIKKILKEGVPHIYQPTGHSCGPTCLKMVHDYFVGDVHEIEDICEACGTDWVVGTPPERMSKGLDYMGIKYIEHMDDEDPFQSLRDSIDKGHPCIIRTITQGIPHWIVAVDYMGDVFKINDPWLGQIEYDEEELDSIWHMRNYFYYEVTDGSKGNLDQKKNSESKVEISPITTNQEYEDVLVLAAKVFSGTQDPESLINYLDSKIEFNLSVKATINGKVVGFYIISDDDLSLYLKFYMKRSYGCVNFEECQRLHPGVLRVNPNNFNGLEGIEGVALGVDPQYKGLGIGKKLIEYSQNLPYDYIWGQQYEELGNIEHWTKRRQIAAHLPGLYVTYQML